MRRVNRNERVRVALTLNGRRLAADAEPRTLLCDFMSAASMASAAPAPY
jgi:aerobic-type carbon monoxide dehydrogenase small subunit (CoxS/CutS family)